VRWEVETRTDGLEAVSTDSSGDWWQMAVSAVADIVWTTLHRHTTYGGASSERWKIVPTSKKLDFCFGDSGGEFTSHPEQFTTFEVWEDKGKRTASVPYPKIGILVWGYEAFYRLMEMDG
jgi:hypothetical protein